ncbi:MAG: hypothetical protein ACREOP_04990 [Thermodesulfobacteriota bacterium]
MGKSYERFLRIAAVAILFIFCIVVTAVTSPADSRAGVVNINTSTKGNTYGEWSGRWWQWLLAIPADVNPNLDETGADCAEGQSGKVWFLAGTFGEVPVVRSCTVPKGTFLFFPILNSLFGAAVGDCQPSNPEVVCNLNDLRESAAAQQNNPTKLRLNVDGVVMTRPDLIVQRTTSPTIDITLPEGNLLGLDPGVYSPHVSDGFWIMLQPLPPGAHTIRFIGTAAGGFGVDIKYNLTVSP